tara:strand:- start:2878 stop:4203 length:1326 start_codon:yes stop_codon:yes gene_type:complete
MIEDRVYQNFKDNIVSQSNSLLLAISGGVDSIVMLDIIHKLKEKYNIISNIFLVFINYKLNENSNSREKICLKLSKKYGYPLILKKSYLSSKNFESNARNERYRYFSKILLNKDIDFVLTAHHKDDQIETLLMKYYDNSDWISYLGIRDKYNQIIRPMLDIQKDEILYYAQDNKLLWIDDPSNKDINFRRNKMRHIILPDIYRNNPGLIDDLMKLHSNAKIKFRKILNKISTYEKDYIYKIEKDFLAISNDTKKIKDISVFKIFYQHILANYLDTDIKKTSKFWLSYNEFVSNSRIGSEFILSKDFTVIKDRNLHYIYFNNYLDNSYNVKINQHSHDWYHTQIITDNHPLNDDIELIDEIKIPYKKFIDGIHVRNWKHGDKCYNSSKSLKNIFVDNKISLFDKMTYPIITDDNDNIICVPKLYNYYDIDDKCKTIYWIRKK